MDPLTYEPLDFKRHRLAADCGCIVCTATRLGVAERWDDYAALVTRGLAGGLLQVMLIEIPQPEPETPPGRRHFVQQIGQRYDESLPDFTTVTELKRLEGTAATPGAAIASGIGAVVVGASGAAVQPMATATGEIVARPRTRGLLRWRLTNGGHARGG